MSLNPGLWNFSCAVGQTFTQLMYLTNQDDGSPFNLTGYYCEITCVAYVGGPILFYFNSTSNPSELTVDASAGAIQLLIPNTATALYAPGIYIYDLWLTSNTAPDIVFPLMYGQFNWISPASEGI